MEKIISRYYVIDREDGEYMCIVAQYMYNERNLKKAIEDAKFYTERFIDRGMNWCRNEVYVHPENIQKPYLNKEYKVQI